MTRQKPTRADLARWLRGAAYRWTEYADELAIERQRFMRPSIREHFAIHTAHSLYQAARHAAREGE